MRDFSFRENPNSETYHRFHISYFSNFVMLDHVRCFQAGNPPRGQRLYRGTHGTTFWKSKFGFSIQLTIWFYPILFIRLRRGEKCLSRGYTEMVNLYQIAQKGVIPCWVGSSTSWSGLVKKKLEKRELTTALSPGPNMSRNPYLYAHQGSSLSSQSLSFRRSNSLHFLVRRASRKYYL